METELRKLQLEEKKILDVFVEICEKYKLRYYLTGGTLLGAVRHKGFIPWDDDIDVVMPRPDYEKFWKVAGKEVKEPIYVADIHHNPESRWDKILLANRNYKIIAKATNNPQVLDAWIDIFPLDGLPNNPILNLIHKVKLVYFESRSKIAQYDDVVNVVRKRGVINNIIVKIVGLPIFTRNKDYRKYILKLDKQLQKYNYEDCKKVCDFTGGFGFKETFNYEDQGDGAFYEFEGSRYKGPVNAKAVLTAIYGPDYMTPPPENDRNKHSAEFVSTK